MANVIQPKLLKGFRDSLPEQEIRKKKIVSTLESVFERYGFVPIDTPVLEYAEVLLGKGGGETDKQVYRFLDHGQRDVAMRFDLTVPFARFMAGHLQELYLPFKRYHTSKVWRGENTQRGRYREFIQSDFDIVGVDTPSADFEIMQVMKTSLTRIGIDRFTIHFSHRGLFNDFLAKEGISDKYSEILRIVDKLAKIGRNEVLSQLSEETDRDKSERILEFIRPEHNSEKTLKKIASFIPSENEGLQRLRALFTLLEETEQSEWFLFDPSITRGLDYYTGLVYETFLTDAESIGSVCSGGRYNNLASLYTKEELPGVGSSIGLDRLLSALDSISIEQEREYTTEVIILMMDENFLGFYHNLAGRLRDEDINCEVYPEKKKLAKQFQYAEKKGIPFAVICGEDERKNGTYTLKDLNRRENREQLSFEAVVQNVKS
jgi:histidyl-tRNA synthetase